MIADVLAMQCQLATGTCGATSLLETDGGGGWDFDAHVAINSFGNAVAVWRRYDDATSISSLRASRLLGGAWDAAPMLIENESYSVDAAPRVAIDAGGNAVAV